jgi:hypothetical protein
MDNQELLHKYSANAAALLTAARAIPIDKITLSPGEDEWSAAYVIHHMTDSELQFGVRYSNLLSEDIPDIVPFDEAKFPAGLHYELRSVVNSLAAFKATNDLNCEILSNTVKDDWNRTAFHPESGLVSLIDLVTLCANHIGVHIEQLQRAVL